MPIMPKRKPSKLLNKIRSRNTSSSRTSRSRGSSVPSLTNASRLSYSHTSLAKVLKVRAAQKSSGCYLSKGPSTSSQCSTNNQRIHASLSYLYSNEKSDISTYVRHYGSIHLNPKILVIEDVENDIVVSTSKGHLNKKPVEGNDSAAHVIDTAIEDFDENEVDSYIINANNIKTYAKVRAEKFVTAWRSGLLYPQTKKVKMVTDIPVAATSHCKVEIPAGACTGWYHKYCTRLLSLVPDEDLLDLLQQGSSEKFMEETEEQFYATSSIVIKKNLKRKQLYDSVHHADSAPKVEKEDQPADIEQKLIDEGLRLEIRFNVPPPVHIEYVPEKTLLQEELTMGLRNKKFSQILEPTSSMTHAKFLERKNQQSFS